MSTRYPSSVGRSANDIAGDFPSFLTFGVSDGVHDVSTILNTAVTSVDGQGRGGLYLPGGVYVLDGTASWSFPNTLNGGLKIYGDPGKTIIQVAPSSTFTSGQGVIDIAANNITFEGIIFDGGVTTPVNINYAGLSTPHDSDLIDNSMFWIHGPQSGFTLDRCTVQHTNGYIIAGDARDGECYNFSVTNNVFKNNRPHLMGDGSVWGGTWTAGIVLFGDGTSTAWHNAVVSNNTFSFNTGNSFWQWAPALSYLHTNIIAVGNTFQDNGLDCIQFGAVNGGLVANNSFRRIGYISTTDDTQGTPVWVNDHYGSAIDTTGVCTNVSYINNTGISINGSCLNLDGFGSGVVSGNSFRQPSSDDLEYTEDDIASSGPQSLIGQNWVAGVDFGNTSNTADGGKNITVQGNTFIGLGGGAINIFGGRNSHVTGNNIIHPANAQSVPIALANLGAGDNQRVTNCVVSGNRIDWAPGSAAPMIVELANGTAFLSTQLNRVNGNICTPGMPEFQADPNSGSAVQGSPAGGAHEFSSNLGSTAITSSHSIQREGKAADYTSVLRFYGTEDTTSTLHMQLQSYRATSTYEPLLNVSLAGAANTGVIATGNYTTAGFGHTVITGKSWSDSFIVINSDVGFTDADADSLDDTHCLFRYKSSVGFPEMSYTTSSGARVWVSLGAGTGTGITSLNTLTSSSLTIAGTTDQIAVSAVSSTITLALTTNVTITGTALAAGLTLSNGYVRSDGGFLSDGTEVTQVNVPLGGITGKYLIGTTSLTLTADTSTNAGLSIPGQGRIYFDSTSNRFLVSENGGSYVNLSGTTTPAAGSPTWIQYNTGGNFDASADFIWIQSTKQLAITGVTSQAAIDVLNGYVQADGGFAVNGSTATDSIKTSVGGVTAKWLITTDSVFFVQESAPSVSASSQSRMYMDSGSHTVKLSMNGGAYFDVLTSNNGVSSVAGSSGVTVSGSTGAVTISIGQPVATSSNVIFNAMALNSTAPNALAVASGGVSAKYLVGTTSLTLLADTSTNAGLSASTQGRIYFDSTLNKFMVSENGGAFVQLLAGSTGVTSLIAGTGVSVSGSTGAVTVSIGQPVATSSNVTFNAMALNSTAPNALGIASGGVSAKYLIGTTSLTLTADSATNAGLSATGQGRFYFDSTSNKFFVSENGGAYVQLLTSSSGVISLTASTGLSVSSSTGAITITNTGVTSVTGTANQVIASAASGGITLSLPQSINTGANVTFANMALSGSAPNALGIASGGVSARYLVGTTSLTLVADSAANAGLSATGQGRIYFDSTANKFFASENGAAYVQLLTAASGVTSLTAGTGVSLSGSTGAVTVSIGQPVSTGSNVTFNAMALNSTAPNALGIASGGVTAKYLVGTTSLTLSADTSTNAGLSNAGQGRIYFDSSLNKFFVSENGGVFVQLVAGAGSVTSLTASTGLSVNSTVGAITITNTGVISLTGTTNQVAVSGSTGAITLSLPQAINTAANPTFANLALSGTATNALGIASGGVSAKYLVGTTSLTLTADTAGNAGLSATNQGRIYFDSTSHRFMVSENGGAYTTLAGVTSVTAGTGIAVLGTTTVVIQNTGVTSLGASTGALNLVAGPGISTSGLTISNLGVTGLTAGTGVSISGSTGAVTLSIGQPVATSSNVTFNAMALTSSATNALAITGGVQAAYLIGTTSLTLTGTSSGAAGLSSTGQGRIYFDSTSNHFMVSENGGGFVNLLGAAAAGSNTQVQYNSGGVFGASPSFTFASQVLTVTASSAGVAGIVCATGFIQSATGFFSTNNAYNTVNLPSGGVLAQQLTIGSLIPGRTEMFQLTATDATLSIRATSSGAYSGLNMFDDGGNLAASFQYGNGGSSFPGNFFIAARTATGILTLNTNGLTERVRIRANGEVVITSGQITLNPMTAPISATNGAHYYNSSSNQFLFFQNGAWVGLGSGSSGVTSLTAGTGISLSGSTGAVTIFNAGVTAINGSTGSVTLFSGTGVSVSGTTISIGQAVSTSSSPIFNALAISASNSNAIQATNGGIFSNLGFNTGPSGVLDINNVVVINASRQITCTALSCSGVVTTAGLWVTGGIEVGAGSFGISVTRAGGTFVNGILVA